MKTRTFTAYEHGINWMWFFEIEINPAGLGKVTKSFRIHKGEYACMFMDKCEREIDRFYDNGIMFKDEWFLVYQR